MPATRPAVKRDLHLIHNLNDYLACLRSFLSSSSSYPLLLLPIYLISAYFLLSPPTNSRTQATATALHYRFNGAYLSRHGQVTSSPNTEHISTEPCLLGKTWTYINSNSLLPCLAPPNPCFQRLDLRPPSAWLPYRTKQLKPYQAQALRKKYHCQDVKSQAQNRDRCHEDVDERLRSHTGE
jgi:hypothetical protein